jgi:hypothetical protein
MLTASMPCTANIAADNADAGLRLPDQMAEILHLRPVKDRKHRATADLHRLWRQQKKRLSKQVFLSTRVWWTTKTSLVEARIKN